MRCLFALIASLVLAALPATARGDAALCDGKYAAAQDMLDAAYGKYGTLYSGGLEWDNDNGVGPTLDLWRLWRGLPDLRFRDAGTFDHTGDWGRDFRDFGHSAADLAVLLRIAARPQADGLPANWRYITARYLNTMVDAGSGSGWWLAPTPRDDTPRQKIVTDAATPGSLMEWLLVTQAMSDTPDAIAWNRPAAWPDAARDEWGTPVAQGRLRDLVSQRALDPTALDWQVAALLSGAREGIRGIWPQRITRCQATGADYAAWAVQTYAAFKRNGLALTLDRLPVLPPQMRRTILANLAMLAVRDAQHPNGRPLALQRLEKIAALDPDLARWLFAGRILTAGSIDDLIAAHPPGTPLDPRAVDTLNLLSLDDLIAFTDRTSLPDHLRAKLVTVIATRAFVLGRLGVARVHLARLKDLMPDHARELAQALDGPGGETVQIARAILALPDPTVRLRTWDEWRSPPDLQRQHISSAVLNRHLRSWMAYPADAAGLARASRRGRDLALQDPGPPFLPEGFRDEGFPFLRLIAWDELGRLGTCHGLTRRLTEVLVTWADQSSDTPAEWLTMDRATLADTLRRLILLNRSSSGAMIGDRPASQRAFALLSTRFAGTRAARATRYWYHKDVGCRG